MRIDHDKVSGALYIKIREGEYDHTEDFSDRADVYLDVDAAGNVLGLEALSFEDLAEAIEEREGRLDVPDRCAYLPADAEDVAGAGGMAVDVAQGARQAAEGAVEGAGQAAEDIGEGAGQAGDYVLEYDEDEEAQATRRSERSGN